MNKFLNDGWQEIQQKIAENSHFFSLKKIFKKITKMKTENNPENFHDGWWENDRG